MYWILATNKHECVVLVNRFFPFSESWLCEVESVAHDMGYKGSAALVGMTMYSVAKGELSQANAHAWDISDSIPLADTPQARWKQLKNEVYCTRKRRSIIGRERAQRISKRVQAQWSVCPTYDVLIGVQ